VATRAAASGTDATVPRYDHIALIVEENHGFNDIIGNPNAPIFNRLANTFGLATSYFATSDPSAPNYVVMLGGSSFGIADDNPFYMHEVHAPSLMDQLDAAHMTWKGYFQGMPYPGFAQYCYPVRCNGTPDSDPIYSSKHNGMPYFASIQESKANLAKMTPGTELATDLSTGNLPNFAYIVPDQCHDMHGSPPWCEDSGNPGDVNDNRLVSDADGYIGRTVEEITNAAQWTHGRNAIVITFDEGDDNAGCCGTPGAGQVATVVITNNGPRHLKDPTPYSHYSLLATMEQAFGLGCLQLACDRSQGAIMAPLFGGTPATASPAAATAATVHPAAAPSSTGSQNPNQWTQFPSPNIGSQDNSLGAISAASPSDIWAVGNHLPDNNPTIVQTLAVHYDGHTWQDVTTPDVGSGLNTLFGVHTLPGGTAWAVGEALGPDFLPRTLVEHFDGQQWSVVPSLTPGGNGVLYGVTATSDHDVWAVGTFRDQAGTNHALAEHFDGAHWTVAGTPDPGSNGNLLYAVAQRGPGDVWAVGQRIGAQSPDLPLIEHFDGVQWSTVDGPDPNGESLVPFGLSLSADGVEVVGSREADAKAATPWAAVLVNGHWSDQPTDSIGTADNFFYATSGSWAVGTTIDSASGNNFTLVERLVGGHWLTVAAPNPGVANGGGSILGGVASVSASEAWAVGTFDGANARQTMILHQNH
jgi:hypothetical protein